jgi:hypothetical protein
MSASYRILVSVAVSVAPGFSIGADFQRPAAVGVSLDALGLYFTQEPRLGVAPVAEFRCQVSIFGSTGSVVRYSGPRLTLPVFAFKYEFLR